MATAPASTGSARPEVSSAFIRSTEDTTYSAAIRPSMPIIADTNASVSPARPPIRAMIARACSLSPTRSAAPSVIPP